jgi:hypothetical protein
MASKKPPKAANDDVAVVTLLPAGSPNGTELMTIADSMCDGLIATIIDSPMMYELASAELIDMQAQHKAMEDKRFSITRPMDAAKAAVMSLFKAPMARLEAGIKSHKAGMLVFDQEQKRKAAITQQRLDKIAADHRALLAAEGVKHAEEARAQSALAASLMNSGDSEGVAEALTKAEEAQEMASALNQTTEVMSAAVAVTNIPVVAGIRTADVWSARVTDIPALLRFIADNPEYHAWIEFKMSGLNEMAKAQRDALRVPGVEAFEEARISARKAA